MRRGRADRTGSRRRRADAAPGGRRARTRRRSVAGSPPAARPRRRPRSPEALAAYLATVAGADQATRQREVASWKLDEARGSGPWSRATAPLTPTISAAFDAALPGLVARLAHAGAGHARAATSPAIRG